MDSVYISRVVRLINDFKACTEYSDELESRLTTARDLIDRTQTERDEYKSIAEDLDKALIESNRRKEDVERKLKRTRKIGIIGTISGFILGVLGILLI